MRNILSKATVSYAACTMHRSTPNTVSFDVLVSSTQPQIPTSYLTQTQNLSPSFPLPTLVIKCDITQSPPLQLAEDGDQTQAGDRQGSPDTAESPEEDADDETRRHPDNSFPPEITQRNNEY